MQNLTALVFDPDTCLLRDLIPSQIHNITLCPTSSAQQLSDSLSKGPADLLMLDMKLPGMTGIALVAELRKKRPGIPAILMSTKAPTDDDWISVASQPLVEVMQTPITLGKLTYHISRLFEKRQPLSQAAVATKPVTKLRNGNGRLDAALVAKVFDLTMTDIAANVGISRQALSKTPDSPHVQPALRDFERVARSLLSVTGSLKGLKMWLHSANERFDDHSPFEVIKLGKIKLLSDWVEDARLGSPD